MTEKRFTKSEINEITNKIYIQYVEFFKTNNMEYKDLALIENVIMKIQSIINEKELKE